MLNVYVHLEVLAVAPRIRDEDDFLDALWRELPDAGVGLSGTRLELTLSQFAPTRRSAARRQASRARCALIALGHADARVRVAATVREGWRDDVSLVFGAVRWRLGVR